MALPLSTSGYALTRPDALAPFRGGIVFGGSIRFGFVRPAFGSREILSVVFIVLFRIYHKLLRSGEKGPGRLEWFRIGRKRCAISHRGPRSIAFLTAVKMDLIKLGLTNAEAQARTYSGLTNRSHRSVLADYAAIASRHLFTLFNFIVGPAAVALFYHREWQAGIAVMMAAVVNTTIGLVQEVRARRQLERLSILTQSRARVIRQEQVIEIASTDIVQGDAILIHSGDTIFADGPLLEVNHLEIDEALLTGESEPVRREVGQKVLSGSVCVGGEGCYRAEAVGDQAFAQGISRSARHYSYRSSPLTRVINQIITILSVAAVCLCALYFILYHLQWISSSQLVLMVAATITSMVPQGLVLTATVSFTLGAVVMSRRGALVQHLHAVEAMAAVNVICTDKTGTLTTNRLQLKHFDLIADAVPEAAVRLQLARFASASIDRQNRNIQAIRTALGDAPCEVIDQLPFKSANRFSAVRIRTQHEEEVLVLGAPETLGSVGGAWNAKLREYQQAGLRTLLFADVASEFVAAADFSSGKPPQPLRPLAIIALADELRPEAADVIRLLSAQGIGFKVVSGDNPDTVRATLAGLALPIFDQAAVSGQDLAQTGDLAVIVSTHTIFGRIEPLQKVQIVEALQKSGGNVAMIGDGVNDVLPIKRADLGIAMGEGSQAARTVAGLVLQRNDFGMLPETIEEGRTIIRNLRRGAKLFLVKNVYSLFMILFFTVGWGDIAFPYQPQQVTLLNWLVIGVPALLITLARERSPVAINKPFLRDVGSFALRTGVIFAAAGITVMLLSRHAWGLNEPGQRTMLLSVLILLGITALHRVLTADQTEVLAADRRLRFYAITALGAYALAMYLPLPARFFQLQALHGLDWLRVIAVVVPTYIMSRFSDRL